jgi:hypothetical protein
MDFTIATVAYADIFDYPLTHEELSRWMIFGGVFPKQKKQYYFLPGRDNLVSVRRERQQWQQEKWKIARESAALLSKIPTTQLVGVTGGLSMNNARCEDDIDLFIVVARGTLWITRLLATIYLWRVRRTRNDTDVANKVCLNMFVTDDHLEIDEHDLFAAHEVLQMEPIFTHADTYKKFLQANTWVRSFLPNAWRYKNKIRNAQFAMNNNVITYIVHCALRLFELSSKALQLWYMRRHRTREIITDTTLRFHPKDARVWVKRKLRTRLARYNIPLDKIFYAR